MNPKFLLILALSFAPLGAGAQSSPDIQSNVTRNHDGGGETERHEDKKLVNGVWQTFRIIDFYRDDGRYGARNCRIAYQGPAGESNSPNGLKVVLVSADQVRTASLGYLGYSLGSSPVMSMYQGLFACPTAGEWQVGVAFENSAGAWDSDYGRNFQFYF